MLTLLHEDEARGPCDSASAGPGPGPGDTGRGKTASAYTTTQLTHGGMPQLPRGEATPVREREWDQGCTSGPVDQWTSGPRLPARSTGQSKMLSTAATASSHCQQPAHSQSYSQRLTADSCRQQGGRHRFEYQPRLLNSLP